MRDDIEELQLEFAKNGTVKRQKLVTENEVLVRNFNESLTLDAKSNKPNKELPVFSLGIDKQKKLDAPVVRLRRLMGNDVSEATN